MPQIPPGYTQGFLYVKEAAARAGVSTRTIRRWIERERLVSYHMGEGSNAFLLVDENELDAVVSANHALRS